MDTFDVDDNLIGSIRTAIKAALEYEELTTRKRKLGITGEVGEILVCYELREHLGLKLTKDPRTQGFDAIDNANNKVQIKTRRSESGNEPKLVGRMSRFSDHPFDYALLAFLGKDYNLSKIWKLSYCELAPIIKKEQTERSGPTLRSFIEKAGKPIFKDEM